MNAPDPAVNRDCAGEDLDQRLAALLAQYDEALNRQTPYSGLDPQLAVMPAEQRGRLQRVLACLHLLEAARPVSRGNASAEASQPTAEPVPPAQAAVLGLVRGEIALRKATGQDSDLTTYLRRFPNLASQLRSLSDATPTPAVPPAFDGGSISLAEPLTIPGYEILGELGRGGMGIVYRARQVALKRLVALKMIHTEGPAQAEHVARLTAEAEVVARLQHPNIVQVYEVGTHRGQPFLALELVPGGSLAQKLAATPLPANVAAQLVETVARAVQYAHQQGIVHRDLKPANVLLIDRFARNDESSLTPKITDFGLAKQLDKDAAQTQSGVIMGTPSYMAPEQAAGRTRMIGPAVDIYALGAILYELVTGRPPFKAATPVETALLVVGEDPVPPRRLQPRLPRDLETICLKCLQKQAHKRYASAADLADDLRRFLNQEPIRARPTPAWERVVKWVRRHPAAALLGGIAGLTVLTLLCVWLGFTGELRAARSHAEGKAREASNARDHAQEERAQALRNYRRARAAVDRYLTEVTEDDELNTEGLYELRKRLLESAREFYDQFVQERTDDPDLRCEQARAYDRLGSITYLIATKEEADRYYQKAHAVFTELVRDYPSVPEYRQGLAEANASLAMVRRRTGHLDEAEASFLQAIALQKELVRDHPDSPAYRFHLACYFSSLGWNYYDADNSAKAITAYQQALPILEQLVDGYPTRRSYQKMLAQTSHQLALTYSWSGKRSEVRPLLERSLALREQLAKAHPEIQSYQLSWSLSLQAVARGHARDGDLTRAEEIHRQVLAIREGVVRKAGAVPRYQKFLAEACRTLAEMCRRRDRFDEAAKLLDRAVVIHDDLTKSHPTITEYRTNLIRTQMTLGKLYQDTNRPADAIACFERAIAEREQLCRGHPAITTYAVELGAAYALVAQYLRNQGQWDQAFDWSAQAVCLLEDLRERDPESSASAYLVTIHEKRAVAFAERGRHAEAMAEWQAMAERSPGGKSAKACFGRLLSLAHLEHATAADEASTLVKAGSLSPDHCYELARVHAVCALTVGRDSALLPSRRDELSLEHGQAAVNLLRQAQAAGYFRDGKKAERLQTDDALAGLRSLRAFQQLLTELGLGNSF